MNDRPFKRYGSGSVHPPATLVFFTLLGSGPELDFVLADVDQPAIADWSAGQVACQILDDLAWLTLPVGWALNENVPVHRFEFLQPSLSLSGVVQEVDSATQLEFPLGQQAAKRPDVVLAEGLAQLHVVGQIGFLAASMLRMSRGLPAATVGCRSASGYQCVKVRMVLELLVPRVEHHQRCGVELSRPPQLGVECFPGTAEQEVIKLTPIAQDQCRELIGKREDNLEVVHARENDCFIFCQPVESLGAAALRAVSIGAGVVDVHLRVTVTTLVEVSFQGRRPAQQDLGENVRDLGMWPVPLHELGREAAERCDHSRLSVLSGVSRGWAHWGHCRTGSQSSGLGERSRC